MGTPNFNAANGSRLVTDRYDFEGHVIGTEFRHTADNIDIKNSGAVYGSPANVEQALENVNTYITSQLNNGIGYVAIPSGYDTWHAANGSINFDNTIPSLDTILNPVFSAIINSTTIPSGFERIKYGGIIFIPAGTYIIEETLTVPAGIILLGEGYGTKICNATSLNLSLLPPEPNISPTPMALFNIQPDNNRSVNDGVVDPNLFIFGRETAICNMTICDNFVENTVLGDIYYKVPQNTTLPLITQQSGSNLLLKNVNLIGRVVFSSGQVVSSATAYAIQIDDSGLAIETILKVSDCFIDGFSQPINFQTLSGSNDLLDVSNSKIRSYGYLTGDDSSPANNNIITSGFNNLNCINNVLYGNSDNITASVFIPNLSPDTPLLQARPKVMMAGNNIIINKSNDTTNSTYTNIYFDTGISPVSTYYSTLVYGNNFQDEFSIAIDATDSSAGASLLITSAGVEVTGALTVDGAFNLPLGSLSLSDISVTTAEIITATITTNNVTNDNATNLTVSSTAVIDGELEINGSVLAEGVIIVAGDTSYLVDSSGSYGNFILNLQLSSSTGTTITLPDAVTAGTTRIIIIKDIGGNAAFPTTITTVSGTDLIEGIAVPITMRGNFQSWTLQSDGVSNWYMI